MYWWWGSSTYLSFRKISQDINRVEIRSTIPPGCGSSFKIVTEHWCEKSCIHYILKWLRSPMVQLYQTACKNNLIIEMLQEDRVHSKCMIVLKPLVRLKEVKIGKYEHIMMPVWLWKVLNISSYGYPGLKNSLSLLRRTWMRRAKEPSQYNISKRFVIVNRIRYATLKTDVLKFFMANA